MTQQLSEMNLEQRFESQINGGDVTWILIPMRHRGKDYYFQFFQGSPWGYLTRPSDGSKRSMVVTIVKMNDYDEGYNLYMPCLRAFRKHLKRLGFTDRIRYVECYHLHIDPRHPLTCRVDLGTTYASSYRKHYIARDEILFAYVWSGICLTPLSTIPWELQTMDMAIQS